MFSDLGGTKHKPCPLLVPQTTFLCPIAQGAEQSAFLLLDFYCAHIILRGFSWGGVEESHCMTWGLSSPFMLFMLQSLFFSTFFATVASCPQYPAHLCDGLHLALSSASTCSGTQARLIAKHILCPGVGPTVVSVQNKFPHAEGRTEHRVLFTNCTSSDSVKEARHFSTHQNVHEEKTFKKDIGACPATSTEAMLTNTSGSVDHHC